MSPNVRYFRGHARRRRLLTGALLASICVIWSAAARAQEPDHRQMSVMTEPADRPGSPSSRALAEEAELPPVLPGPPLTLAEALRMADRRNLTLSAARLEIDKARAQLKQAWALVLPAAQANLQLVHRDHEDSFNLADALPPSMAELLGDTSGMGDMVIAQQQILTGQIQVGMKLIDAQGWLTIGAAKKGVELAEVSIEDARQRLLLGVAQAFFYSLTAKSLIELHLEQVTATEHHLEVAKARESAGETVAIDVLRAETDLEQARQRLIAANLAYENARDALGMLTGANGMPTPVDSATLAVPLKNEDQWVDTALDDSAAIRVGKARVELMRRQLDAAWMQFLPTLDVGWGLDYQFTEPPDLGSNDRSRWAVIFTLSVPIYNHFRYGDLDYKRATLRQALIQLDEARQSSKIEVRRARREYLAALGTVITAERQAELAARALSLVETSYAAGISSSLDVTDARRVASAAGVNLAAQRLAAQIALLGLLRAAGEDILGASGSGEAK